MNESFLSEESSDTLHYDLIGLSKQRVTYPKNPIIRYLNINSVTVKMEPKPEEDSYSIGYYWTIVATIGQL